MCENTSPKRAPAHLAKRFLTGGGLSHRTQGRKAKPLRQSFSMGETQAISANSGKTPHGANTEPEANKPQGTNPDTSGQIKPALPAAIPSNAPAPITHSGLRLVAYMNSAAPAVIAHAKADWFAA